MDQDLKSKLTARASWLRGLYMLLFVVLYNLAELVLAAVVLFQFVATLVTGSANPRLLPFGASLSTYIYQVLRFLTYNTEEKPFPFGEWPDSAAGRGDLTRSGPDS